MDNAMSAVEWYRDCIHQKQRLASALSIEVAFRAQDKEDPRALIETLDFLNAAIEILEQAEATGIVRSQAIDLEREPCSESSSRGLMDDLGHSMEPIDFAQPSCRLALREGDDRSRLPSSGTEYSRMARHMEGFGPVIPVTGGIVSATA
jgi:hypothetical protein